MAEDQDRPTAPEAEEGQERGPRRLPLKAMLIVLAAFVLQVAVVLLVFHLAKPTPIKGAPGASEEVPADQFCVVDLGTYNITHSQSDDPVNRRQLVISLGLSVKRNETEKHRPMILDQKVWIGQLLEEVLGVKPMTKLHVSDREPLKNELKEKINARLGGEPVQEVILRIQSFGP